MYTWVLGPTENKYLKFYNIFRSILKSFNTILKIFNYYSEFSFTQLKHLEMLWWKWRNIDIFSAYKIILVDTSDVLFIIDFATSEIVLEARRLPNLPSPPPAVSAPQRRDGMKNLDCIRGKETDPLSHYRSTN